MRLHTLDDSETRSRTVLTRIDVNSPMDPVTGRILDEHRFVHHRKTLRELEDAAVAVIAHQSRPGKSDFTTLEKHAAVLEDTIGRRVTYIPDYFGPTARKAIKDMEPGDVLLLENVRFYSEENIRTLDLDQMETSHPVRALAPLFDLYINDAFACSHRNQISMVGYPATLPAAAGRLLEREVTALDRAAPGPGTLFLLGGAKMEDSLNVAENVLAEGSTVAATGLFANLMLQANGKDLGEKSEEILRDNGGGTLLDRARKLLDDHGDSLILPVDIAISQDDDRLELFVDELPVDATISDIGLETVSRYAESIEEADAVVCNGPAGIFEDDLFAVGTNELLSAMASSSAFTVLGGGHIVTALRSAGLEHTIDHVSSGGGALLSYIAGEDLPGLSALTKK